MPECLPAGARTFRRQQAEVVFGKWCADDADVLILDCPTRGVDIGVKAAMYQLIYDMKKQGKSIIMISEELPELMGMCDRLLIMRDGAFPASFTARTAIMTAN